jgi:ribonuclease HII
MQIAERLFPGYDFATHKGYPTVSHRAALNRLGPCPLHRRSFGPVKRIVELANPDGVSPL